VRSDKLIAPGGYAHSTGKDICVTILGYLGHQKGTFDILKVAKKIENILPDMKFLFIGGGEIEKFTNLVREEHISNVSFLGRLDDETCIRTLQSSDVFLLPSHAEGQPIALLEAMATGLPVISTTVGSIPEVVKERTNGFLVNPGDTDSIIECLKKLAFDEDLRIRMGRQNALEAKEKYNLERVMTEIEHIYDGLLGS
jgi:glycosyltransferase involved in cell wall biosynthesis